MGSIQSPLRWSSSTNTKIKLEKRKKSITHRFPVDFWYIRGHLFHKCHLENCEWLCFRGDRGEREVVPVPFHQSCTRPGARCTCRNECTEICTGKTSACCNSNPLSCPWLKTLECWLCNERKNNLSKMTNENKHNYERWQILSSVNKCERWNVSSPVRACRESDFSLASPTKRDEKVCYWDKNHFLLPLEFTAWSFVHRVSSSVMLCDLLAEHFVFHMDFNGQY